MRKFLFLISFVLAANFLFAQSISLGINDTDVSSLSPGDKVYVTLTIDDITPGSEIWGWQLFINIPAGYLSWDGTSNNPMPGITYVNPLFPPTVIPANTVNWFLHANGVTNVFGYLFGDGANFASLTGQTFPVTIITLQFTYLGGVNPGQTIPIIWSTDSKGNGLNAWKVGGPTEVYYNDFFELFPTQDLTNSGSLFSPAWDVTFEVKDGLLPVDGADVTVGSETITTDANGIAVFSRPDGSYSYTVSKTGYPTKTGNFTVAGSDLTIVVEMGIPVYDVTFQVTDGTNNIEGAMVAVGSQVLYTNASGLAVFSLEDGSYTYNVSKFGYTSAAGSFAVTGSPLTIPVTLALVPQYAVTFNVTSGGSGLQDAIVTIPGVGSVLTNASGEAVFNLTDGTFNYNVIKSGYTSATGAITVSGASLTVPVELFQLFAITFHVTSDGVDLPGALVTVGTQTLTTNANGLAVFELVNGSYTYLVTKAGYTDEAGSFVVTGAPMTIPVVLSEITYEITFHATSGGANLDGVLITIGSLTQLTNSNGIAAFLLPSGFYEYDAEKDGYYPIFEEPFIVAGAPLTIPVDMVPQFYATSFHVTSGGQNLSGASVTVNGQTLVTPASGMVVFQLQNGTYNYSVTKDGYIPVDDNVVVNNAPQTVGVDMVLILFDITFHVSSDGEDLEGATVTIAGQTLTTPGSGIVVFNLPNGTYSYTVTKNDYTPVSGNITVSNAPQTIEIQMVKILYQTIFAVINPNNQPVSGAAVTVEGFGTQNTPGNGTVIFQLPNGSYPYTVEKDGFITGSGTVVVSGAGQTVIVQLQFQPYDITFVVTDEFTSLPLAGAVVTIGTQNQTTPPNGTVIFQLANGTYNYTVTKALFVTATGQVTVSNAPQTIEVELVLISGVNELSVRNFSLYPNPSNGLFYLSTTATGHDLNLSVYDLSGRVIYNDISGASTSHMIDLSGQDKGMYILQIITDGNVITKTLVIQ